jgi:hypothetical protein
MRRDPSTHASRLSTTSIVIPTEVGIQGFFALSNVEIIAQAVLPMSLCQSVIYVYIFYLIYSLYVTFFACAKESNQRNTPREVALRVRSVVWKNQVADKLASLRQQSAFPLIFPALFRRLQGVL